MSDRLQDNPTQNNRPLTLTQIENIMFNALMEHYQCYIGSFFSKMRFFDLGTKSWVKYFSSMT